MCHNNEAGPIHSLTTGTCKYANFCLRVHIYEDIEDKN